MKKYKLFFVALVALILATVIVINVSAKPNIMSEDCADDGSCCEDEFSCSCG